MAIFKKNPNEANYVGGKKHWVDVIKNRGDGNLLLWRQPEEDFNTNSTCIVMPGEEALFVNGGVIEQVLPSGTHKLSTNNYPFLTRLRTAFSGGISTYNCVIYYIRKASSVEIYWGTDSPVQVRDPNFKIIVDVQARGSYKIRVNDSSKFLEKLIGANIYAATQDDLTKFFRNEFLMHIKTQLTKVILESNEDIIGLCAKQEFVAKEITNKLAPIFDDYGIMLDNFAVSAIDVVDNENRQKLENAIADVQIMGMMGANWGAQKQFEIMKDVANNPSQGGLAGLGAGLGMGVGMGGAFGGMAQNMFNNGGPALDLNQTVTNPLDNLGGASAGGFQQVDAQAQAPAAPAAPVAEDPLETLKKLKQMLEMDIISQAEFDAKKEEILKRM